jgi:hypothetical protein
MFQKLLRISSLTRFSLKTSHLSFLALGIATALGLASPASAQTSTIIYQGTTTYDNYRQPTVTNFIYGSPIPTPVPVNPITGQIIDSSNYSIPQVRRYRQHSYPPVRQNFTNSTFVNPVLVNPRIHNSTIINPTIVNDSYYHRPGSIIRFGHP